VGPNLLAELQRMDVEGECIIGPRRKAEAKLDKMIKEFFFLRFWKAGNYEALIHLLCLISINIEHECY
jgi:hypothetical protein